MSVRNVFYDGKWYQRKTATKWRTRRIRNKNGLRRILEKSGRMDN